MPSLYLLIIFFLHTHIIFYSRDGLNVFNGLYAADLWVYLSHDY